MQHRLGGLQQAVFDEGREDLADFPVVVTIADGLSKLEEVEQFELINTTQKKVRTDLARRLMAIQSQDAERRKAIDERGRLWEARGPLVADWLNRHGTWWVGRIIPPNKSKRETPAGIIRETSFVTSLKPILQMPLFQRMADDQVSDVLNRYWSALCGYFPEAFARPNDHVIQKTPGVFSLHMLFPEVAEIARSNSGDMSLESLASAMKSWGDLDSDFWDRDNEEGAGRYGNMKGFARLAAELRHLLPTLDIDI